MRRLVFLASFALFAAMLIACSSNNKPANSQAVGDTESLQQQIKDLQATIAALQARTPQVPVAAATQAVASAPAQTAASSIAATRVAVAATQAQALQTLQITAKGYGIDQNGQLAYAFLVQNPNAGLAFTSSSYQIAVYDASGTVLKTDSGYLDLILPQQQFGVAGNIYLNKGAKSPGWMCNSNQVRVGQRNRHQL